MIFDKAKPLTAEHGEGLSSGGASHTNYPRIGRDYSLFFNLIAGRTPRSTPMAFWRSIGSLKILLRITTLSLISLGVFLLAALVVELELAGRFLDGGGVMLVAVLLMIHSTIFLYGFHFSIRRYQRFLKEHEWLVCMRCGYVLEHLPSSYNCPECGDVYDFETLRLSWQEWVNSNMANRAK